MLCNQRSVSSGALEADAKTDFQVQKKGEREKE